MSEYSEGDAVRIILMESNDGGTTWTPILSPSTGGGGSTLVQVRKNSVAVGSPRDQINFIEGSNVTLTVTDDGSEVDVTIAAAGGGGGGDHGGLTGLADDDHTQYALADGSRGTFEASGAVATHSADTTSVHGIADTSALLDTGDIGSTVQAYDSDLAAISLLTTTSFGRGMLVLANAADLRTLAQLEPGTDVMAYDAELAALGSLTSAADKLPYFSGVGTAATTNLTAFGRTLIDDADAAAARSTLALGGAATLAVGTTAGTVAAGDHTHSAYAVIERGQPKSATSTPLSMPGIAPQGFTTFTVTANRLYHEMRLIEDDITIDQLAVQISTGVAGNVRLGLYSADTEWQPTGTVFLDAGTASTTTSTTWATVSLGSAQALARGRYVFVAVFDAAPSVRVVQGACENGWGLNPTASSNVATQTFYRSFTYAALPSSPTDWDTLAFHGGAPYNFIAARISAT